MTLNGRRTTVWIALSCLCVMQALASERRAAILDRGGKSLTIVDAASGATIARIPLAYAPESGRWLP